MATVEAIQIQNVSRQIIKFMYQSAPNRGFLITDDVANTSKGMIQLAPQKKIILQAARVNLGQLSDLEAKGLIKTTRTSLAGDFESEIISP